MAVVGLGSGILAAYGKPGQRMDFYELDPYVVMIASKYFTFLADSSARAPLVSGDARLSLQRGAGGYDLIVLDAFTGGSIPVHTLTREAFATYEGKLAPGGLIAVHITNRFLNLRPPLAAVARAQGLRGAARMTSQTTLKEQHYYSSWVAIAKDEGALAPLLAAGWEDLSLEQPARPWTDQHASLLSALK